MSLVFKNRRDIKINNINLYDRYDLVAVESELITTNAFGKVDIGSTFNIKFIRKRGNKVLHIVNVPYLSRTYDNEINRIFFEDDEIMMEVGGKLYFVKAKESEVTKYRNFEAIDITLEMLSDVCYGYLTRSYVVVNEEKDEIDLYNNGIRDIPLKVAVKASEDCDVTITKNGETITIKDLKKDEEIYIYDGDIEGDYNKVTGSIYECLTMECGRNTYKVTGNCRVNFEWQSEYGLS